MVCINYSHKSVPGLETGIKDAILLMEHKFPFRIFRPEEKTGHPFQISVLSLHEIFPWNKLQSRVSFTLQPDVPKHFVNEKQPPKESVIHTVYSGVFVG